MTFTEAAVEVLRLVGKPLHYKKITELAIERNLLSHVGKTPEVTMSSRLATMVKRDRGEVPIIKVKPGVFGLREFNEEQLADLSGDVDELPEVEVEEEQEKAASKGAHNGSELRDSVPDLLALVPTVEAPRKPLPGADVFPEEDDDDEPILGGGEDEDEDDESEEPRDAQGGSDVRSASSRRRRKRRRRGAGEESPELEARPREAREPREPRDAPREERSARAPRELREGRRDERVSRDDRRRERDERRDRDEPLDLSREPGDGDLLGKDLADAVASVLGQSGPRGLPPIRIADQLVRRGRLHGDPNALVPTIMASVRADIARKRGELARARFRLEGSTVVLTDFLLPQDVVRAEQDVLRAAERQRERVRRAFLRKLGELPGAGLAELVATWLNAEGVVGLHAVRRPGAGVGELHLAGTLRRGADEIRLAVVVYREGRELGRERVIEARGALHYYGNASATWLVTLGNVMSGAREEASAPASGPVALYDGLALAAAMEKQGVGLAVQYVPISALDFELLDVLRGQLPREREAEPERGRERRDRDRERAPASERDRDRERAPASERDRDRERAPASERERERVARPAFERAGEARDELEPDLDLDDESDDDDEVAVDETDEGGETQGAPALVDGAEPGGEGRESGRRRRRRRRRKGGRGPETAAAQASDATEGESAEVAPWAEGEEPEDDEDEERAFEAREVLDADRFEASGEAGSDEEDAFSSSALGESEPPRDDASEALSFASPERSHGLRTGAERASERESEASDEGERTFGPPLGLDAATDADAGELTSEADSSERGSEESNGDATDEVEDPFSDRHGHAD